MEWYYVMGAVAYGLFVVQFLLSWIGGDFEVDVDLDGDSDVGISDIVSFKGLIHFLMGFSSWIILKSRVGELMWWDYSIAILLGLLFVFILYYIYKLFLKLECKPKVLTGDELVGKPATVYLPMGKGSEGLYNYVVICDNGVELVELNAKSDNLYKTGDSLNVVAFVKNYYII